MTRIRAALPAALLLAGGCVTVPSGIVDNFVPPQGQTVVAEVKTPLCENEGVDAKKTDPNVVAPCMTEVVTIAAAPKNRAVPTGFQRNRPRPPLIRRR